MRANSSFRDILNQKMTGATSRPPTANQTTEGLDPAHMAFLLGQVAVTKLANSTVSQKFGRPPKRPAQTRARPQGPAHSLDERQKLAFAWFLDQGESLLADFNAQELKGAFRRLARRLHPDVTKGPNGPFLELQGHHRALRTVNK